MNILISQYELLHNTGAEVYIRDLAIGLKSRGVNVEIYCPNIGALADEIMSWNINVTGNANEIKNTPDLIHCQNNTIEYMVYKFPNTPIVYFSHSYAEKIIPNKIIKKYVAVDYNCMENLLQRRGVSESDAQVIYNWVDTNKFKQKEVINKKVKSALIFSNYATPDNFYTSIMDACDKLEIKLDVIGIGFGNVKINPEECLVDYDIVFAKGKCALEAMACGCAVIMCDYAGLGEMVSLNNFNYARSYNFGFKNLTRPHNINAVVEEIKKYDAIGLKNVSDRIRLEADFDKSLNEIIYLYNKAVQR